MASSALRSGKYAASTAKAQASLREPLVPNKQSRSADSVSSSESTGDSGDGEARTLRPRFFGKDFIVLTSAVLLAAGGLAGAATAMVAMPSVIVFVMGGVCMLNAPLMALKQIFIARHIGIRTSINSIREEATFLKDEVRLLAESVKDLRNETIVLKDLEQDLHKIAAKQRVSVGTIVDLVNENEELLGEMKSNLTQVFVQSIVKVVMRSDTDGSMTVNEKELPLLALRLQIQLEPYDIKLDQDMFEEMIREDNDISNVFKFCGQLLFQEDHDDDDDDTSSYGSVTRTSISMDLEDFCRTISDQMSDHNTAEPALSFEEKAGMISINEKFSGGSVEVARGGRSTLFRASKSPNTLKRITIAKQVRMRQTRLDNRKRLSLES